MFQSYFYFAGIRQENEKTMRMKKFLPFLSIAFLLAACSSKPETQTQTLQSVNQSNAIDTAGLAQFQQWKAQNELSSVNAVQTEQEQAASEPAPVQTKTIVREVIVERPVPARQQTVRRTSKPKAPVTTPPVSSSEPSIPSSDGNGSNPTVGTGGETAGTSETPASVPEVAKKEGWSKAAKGAAIGGAGGAVIGAVIGKKNRAAGAVIGGVLGGAVGYGIGKSKDKKDGRN